MLVQCCTTVWAVLVALKYTPYGIDNIHGLDLHMYIIDSFNTRSRGEITLIGLFPCCISVPYSEGHNRRRL